MLTYRKFAQSVMIFSLFSLISGCGESQEKQESLSEQVSLTMGTSADMPPFELYRTGEGEAQIVGFDVDLAKAIGEKLGIDVKVKDIDFPSLIPSLQAGRIDFVMSSMTPTAERKKNIDFSKAYLSIPVAAVTFDHLAIKDSSDLSGKKIGVQLGSTNEQLARELANKDPTIKLTALNKLGELIQELLSGRIDVVLMETTSGKSYAKNAPHLKVTPLPEHKFEFAIAFAKKSPWIEKFNKAIDELEKSEKIKELKEKWLSSEKPI